MKITTSNLKSAIVADIDQISGEKVADCYQCGKCTAACPVSAAMDILPHRVLRLLQLGQVDPVLESRTIWICASCFTCAGRCPRDVDLAGIMEALRLLLLRKRGITWLRAEDMPALLGRGMPEQGIVSGFRKYTR